MDDGIDDGKFFDFDVDMLRKHTADAFLGYLSMNIVRPPNGTIWGKFNNRPLNMTWVKSMADSFVNTIDNCVDNSSMDLALDPKWLVDLNVILRTVEGLKIRDVPVLKFNDEGLLAIKNDNLWVLGGNHRRISLTRYIDRMRMELTQMKEAIGQALAGMAIEDIENINTENANTLKEA